MKQFSLMRNKFRIRKEVLIAVILLLVASAVIIITYNYNSGDSNPTSGMRLELDEDAEEYTKSLPESDISAAGIQIPGYASITIPAETTQVEMALLNPERNPCYFTFEIVLDDTGETIYTSNMVEPSKYIKHVTLAEALQAGEYGATIKIRTYSLDDLTELNGANVQTVLVVV